jgi:hypothetical protein
MADQFDNEPMPANATRNLFVWASGFGIGRCWFWRRSCS